MLRKAASRGIVNLASQDGVAFCPWRGTRLADWIDAHREDFDRLATSHERLLL